MDWRECIKERIVKNVKSDKHLILSMKEISTVKIKAADAIPEELYLGKIVLLYDALRELLECNALERGYKIYNHECYYAFLKEIMQQPKEAETFDKLRKIRNGINYYGEKVEKDVSKEIIYNLKLLIEKFGN